jgi:hypothetical protein
MSIELKFAVTKYSPKLEPNEVPLKLCFYATCPEKPICEIRTIDSKSFTGSLILTAPANHPAGTPFLANDTQLVIMDFFGVKTEDEVKIDAVNQLGTARIALRDIIGKTDISGSNFSMPLVVKNAVSVQKEWDGVKSHLSLTFAKPVLRGCKNPLMPPDEFCIDRNNYEIPIKILKNVFKSDQGIYQRLRPTFSSLSGLQEPPDQFDDIVVPGSCFVNFACEQSPEEFYHRSSRAALFRCYPRLSESEAEAHVLSPACTEEEYGDLLATMFTIYSNFCAYLPDAANYTIDGQKRRVDYEYFSNHLRTGQAVVKVKGKTIFYPPSGDCEDLQNEQAHQAMDFKGRKFKDPLLQKLVQVRDDYMYAMSIMGVRGNQLSDGKKADYNDPYANQCGHAAGKLYKKTTLVKEHGLVNTAKPLFPTINAPADISRFDSKSDIIRLMEGTGPAEVRQLDIIEYNKMGAAFGLLKSVYSGIYSLKPISFNKCTQLNEFYRSVHVLEFPDLAHEGYRNNSFVVLNMQKGEPTLGVTYTDFMNPSQKVGLRAQPERSDEEILVLNRLMAMYPPVRAHRIPDEPETCGFRGPLYDKMYEVSRIAAAKKLARHADATPVLFITPFSVLASDDVILGLKAIAAQQRVCEIDAREVALDEACGGYNIKVWVNPE